MGRTKDSRSVGRHHEGVLPRSRELKSPLPHDAGGVSAGAEVGRGMRRTAFYYGALRRCRARAAEPESAFHPQLLEIELAFDLAQRLVIDLPAVAQLDHRRSLRADDGKLDL